MTQFALLYFERFNIGVRFPTRLTYEIPDTSYWNVVNAARALSLVTLHPHNLQSMCRPAC